MSLGAFPTPLEHLPNLGSALGHSDLYVKRDDLTGLSLGGNKTRSLEFLLGEAIAGGCDTVIAAGTLQSSLCSLSAAACAKTGLRCIIVHNADRPDVLEGNMLLSAMFGAEPVFLGTVTDEERAVASIDAIATVYDDYLGVGYATPTEESLAMVRDLPLLEGVLVANVYTAKTAAGLAGLVRRGVIPGSESACFIHTGGMGALFTQFH